MLKPRQVARQISTQIARAMWLRVVLLSLALLLCGSTQALAQLAPCVCGFVTGKFVLKTITIDGNMSDWNSVLANPENVQCDPAVGAGDRDSPITGRDLVTFAATWDNGNLYVYTGRSGSNSNQISYAYFADTNDDGKMETGEPVVAVTWQGSNGTVSVYVAPYTAANAGGDLLTDSSGYADGYSMPGTIGGSILVASGKGSPDGYSMEWAVPWAALGIGIGDSIRWHVSSYNGSLGSGGPANDNMGGCGACLSSTAFSAVNFSPDDNVTASRSTSAYLPHVLTNAGSTTSPYELTSAAGGTLTGATVKYYKDLGTVGTYDPGVDVLLTDTNANGTPDTGTIAYGASMNILVAVTTPEKAGVGTVTTTATSSAVIPCSTLPPVKASVTDTITVVPDISGSVYSDLNHNGQMDGNESGSGLTLYVKLVPSASSTATKLATVDPATGGYRISQDTAGNYTLVLDNNSNLADITPTLPFGWIGTQASSLQRSITVADTDITLQNFGLWHGSRISGVVYNDSGAGGGTANDGFRQANEAGITSVPVTAKDSATATVYDSTHTDSIGAYDLYIPSTATAIDIAEVNPAGYVSTGGSPGTTGGVYSRTVDKTSFTATQGSVYTGVQFGDVPDNQMAPDGALSGLPGTVVLYPHVFTAGSAGSVTFTISSASSGGTVSFSEILYRDTNCNGAVDSGEPKIFGALALASGEKVCLVVEEQIPAEAAFDTTNKIVLAAQYSFSGALPSLTTSYGRTDLTTVGEPENSGLKLSKAVDKSTALPGDVLVYTITFSNNSSGPLSNVVVNDSTPAYTRYQAASCGAPLPSGLSGCSVTTQPAVNGTGAIQWTLAGSVDPGASGTLSYSVTVQ
jgi:uncharacterized repeat protein (TIGR01451 family)